VKLSSLINSRRLNEDQIAAAEELIDRGFNTVVDVAIGVGEVGLSMISGAVAEPASGLYGLGSLVFQDLDSATGDIERIQNRMTYEPRTEAGKKGIGYLGSTIGKIGEAVDNFSGYLGDKVLDATGSPELAAAAAILPTAAFEILPTGKAPTKLPKNKIEIDEPSNSRYGEVSASQIRENSPLTISSQRYIDEGIVDAKIEAGDYEVMVSPSFIIDGEEYRVVLDGHHSLEAAKRTGSEPVFITADPTDHDAVSLISESPDLFLDAVHMGNDYYDVFTGDDLW